MIYIIGGNGFVGSAIARACKAKSLTFELLTRENLDSFTGTSCDLLINANGNSKKFMAEREPLWEFDASVRSVRASLENIKAKKYVHLSTCDVYPDCSAPEHTREDQVLDITKQSAYGFHKYLAEQCVMRHAASWLIFRMGGFVGPGLKKNAIYDILHGGPLWLNPESALQFIHVDDAAEIILTLALSETAGEIINLCADGTIALREVLETVAGPVEIKQEAPTVTYCVSIEKLKKFAAVPETRKSVLSYVKEQQLQ